MAVTETVVNGRWRVPGESNKVPTCAISIGHEGMVDWLARRVDIALTRRRGRLPASSLWRSTSSGIEVPVNVFLFPEVGYPRHARDAKAAGQCKFESPPQLISRQPPN
jgi:hypothetical protein